MADVMSQASALSTVLDEAPGMVGAMLTTLEGELRAVAGSVRDGEASAAAAAVLARELDTIGTLLGLGQLELASLKAPRAARVFARQGTAVLAIELDPKQPLGSFETRLRKTAWAPSDEVIAGLAVNRVPTVELHERVAGSTQPPPLPSSPTPITATTTGRLIRSATGAPTRPPPPPGARAAGSPTSAPTRAAGSTSTRLPSPPMGVPTQARTPNSGQVFAGDLEEFCLPDLLQFLRNSQRSGQLVCTTASGTGTVQLSRGMIIGASSPHALDLRDHFMTSPGVGADQRRALASLPAECFSEDTIVSELVSRELAARDDVERARVARIYSAFREMMAWTVGRFAFDPGVPVTTNPTLALSAQSILMHLCQEQDEQNR